MSKRTAQGPQGDKDSGLDFFNMSSTPDDKPQRATAAQLANRKIKAINRRTRPSSPATSSSAQQSFSPFTSLDPNTVSSTSGGSQPPNISNGFTFGQSQSFPGASSNPASNGTQPVSFGAGGGSSFNFSSSFDTGPSVSNPFANMNGGGSSQGSGGSFGGFKGNIFNLPPASQTQNQQPATSSGLFGAQPQQNGTGSVFGGFGNNASATTASPFQSTPSTAPSTGGLFGQSSSQATTAPSSGLFGQTSADKPTIFGNSTAFSAPSDSMQTSPDSKAGAGKPLFGTGATSQPPPTFGSLGSSGTKPLFGATSENKTPFAQAPPSPFGGKSAEASTSATTGGSIFGMPPKPGSSATATTSSAPATTSAASTPSLFGTNASTATSAPTFQASQPPSGLFSGTPFSGAPKPAASQPAAGSTGLFSFGSPAEKKTEESKAPTTDAATESKKDDSAPKPSSGLFGSTPGFGQPPASNIFTPKAPSTTEQTPAQTAPANPFSGLFAMTSPAAQEKPQTSPFQASNAFSSKPEAAAADSAPAPKRPSLFAAGPSTSSAATGTGPFSIKGAAPTTTISANTSTGKVDPAVSNGSVTTSKASFGTKGPRSLPPNLSKELRDDVDLLHRVRTLNECFKRKISELDASKDDFDVVILFYMRVRETLGAPVGESRSTASKRKAQDSEETETALQKKPKSTEQPTDQPTTNLFSASPFKPAASSDTAASHKRKVADDADGSSQPEKRTSTAQTAGSTTASIFASSFSGSQDSKTTAATAPETSTAAPAFKPVFSQSSASASSSNQSPFSLKPSSEKVTETPAKPAFGVPKFGSGAAPNFLSQFKQQADKDAEKEKAKRKAEDFDSDEDDEAEWERKDAEEQRKKREEFEALSKKRAKFVPGKGFVFDEETSEEPAQSGKATAPALPPTSSSVFQKIGSQSPPKTSNIFGHLSGTNSEAEAGDDDSDKESVDGDVSDSAGVKALPAPPTEGSADSSDEGDISKALKKKSEESAAAKKEATPSAPTPQSGRSLFDRIQYDGDGKPKREGQSSEEKKDQDSNVSTLFGNTKFASSVNASSSGSPSIFSTSAPGTPKAGSIFGSSLNTGGGLFGSPTPAAANTAGSTTSSFGDHTWKKDSPIKFSGTTSAAESSSGTAAAGDSKPLSTLFGGSIAQKPSGNSTGAPQLGFAFGGPSQGTSSIFSSAGVSATPSGTSTPAATSDTGAEDSADGDAAPSEPQVDLARSRAGEEDEDMLIEIRARALKMESGWQSQGVGWLRVLKHKTTSRSRVILRADPSGKVVLNASLLPQIKYKESGTSVQFLVPKAEGAPEQWAIRVKKEEVSRLAKTMEEAKT
ncbi:RanBP1 domain protein [Paecilomyces variotii No. 5]|uniref:RanBP1 domain protein n=1 Tax=Byssochlamys spectabilis (strain No. 5 / NBRC 109023) TaxID=1356009 RepID=V5FWI9_BYSSN|nr:RanBP1 domain protein [Paecilomyces variotii No. 5]